MLLLGLHQNRVTGFPRPTVRVALTLKLAASRRKVVSKSAAADLDRCPRGGAGHVAIPDRSIHAFEPQSARRKSRYRKGAST